MSNQSISNSGDITAQTNIQTQNAYINTHPAPSYWVRIEEKDHQVWWRGNIEPSQIDRLWQDPAQPTVIEYSPEIAKFEVLSSALIRVAIHSSSLTLRVLDPTDWHRAAGERVRKCMGAEGARWEPSSIPSSADGWRLDSLPPCSLSPSFETHAAPNDIAKQIEGQLDQWVIHKLNAKLSSVLVDGNLDDTHFPIEHSLAELMWRRWQDWKGRLDSSPDLRHHFLATLLTTAHNNEELRTFARVGRRTLIRCVLRPVIFALGIAVAIDDSCLPDNAHESANLIFNKTDTHLVGLELFENKLLRLALQHISWRASCVFLPHIEAPPHQIKLLSRRYSDGPQSGLSFRRPDLANPTVLTSHSFQDSCGQGLEALRATIQKMLQTLLTEQSQLLEQISANRH